MVARKSKLADAPPAEVAAPPDPVIVLEKGKPPKVRYPCGYCSNVNKQPTHALCPVFIKNADPGAPGKVWHCICAESQPELHPRIPAPTITRRGLQRKRRT